MMVCRCGEALEPGRSRCNDCHATYMRKWRRDHKPNPQKNRARSKADYEKRAGRLRREPCVVCGDPNAQMHHADYQQPLDVIWLCKSHHLAWHNHLRRLIEVLFDRWVKQKRISIFSNRAA